jgi:ATP-dependent RNA helicase DOB1
MLLTTTTTSTPPPKKQGKPSPLVSRFRLSYYTLLNLLRRREEGGAQLDAVVARSFQQFQFERAAPAMERELREVEAALRELDGGGGGGGDGQGQGGGGAAAAPAAEKEDAGAAAVGEYRELRAALRAREDALYAQVLARPDRVLAFLRPGRVVRVRDGATDWGWGVVVGVLRRPPSGASAAAAAAAAAAAEQQPPSDGANGKAAAAAAAAAAATDPASYYVVDTLLACAPGSVASGRPRPSTALLLATGEQEQQQRQDKPAPTQGQEGGKGGKQLSSKKPKQQQEEDRAAATAPPYEAHVIPVALPLLRGLSSLRVAVPADLRPADARRSALLAVAEAARRYPAGRLPRLDPVEDMRIEGEEGDGEEEEEEEEEGEEEEEDNAGDRAKEEQRADGSGSKGNSRARKEAKRRGGSKRRGDAEPRLARLVREVEALEARLAANAVFRAERRPDEFAALARRAALGARASELRAALGGSLLSRFRREASDRERVLRALGHVDASGVVTLKGRAACEVDAGDELVLTELMFDGTLASLDANLLAALLSCFVPVEQSQEQVALTRVLAGPLARLQAAARRVAAASTSCGLPLDAEEYCEAFRPTLMDVVYLWSRGEPFSAVSQRTDVFEGSLVRAVRRLDELMQQLALAAASVGDGALQRHVDASAATLRRGVMFAASLYI